jgi:hypothetical protein
MGRSLVLTYYIPLTYRKKIFLFFAVLDPELRAYTLSYSTSPFLRYGLSELFAQVGFELRSS